MAGSINTSCAVCFRESGACTGKEAELPEEETADTDSRDKEKKGSSMALIFILAGAAATAGWYLKIYRPKKELDNAEDLDDLLDDEPEVNEDDAEEKTTMDDRNTTGYRPEVEEEAADFRPDEEEAAGFGSEMYEDAAAYDDYPDDPANDGPDDAWPEGGME